MRLHFPVYQPNLGLLKGEYMICTLPSLVGCCAAGSCATPPNHSSGLASSRLTASPSFLLSGAVAIPFEGGGSASACAPPAALCAQPAL